MALKKNPPISSKEYEKHFRTQAEAKVYMKATKAQYKQLGISTQMSIYLDSMTNQWCVTVHIYD